MGKVIVVISGTGSVGKTTSTAALGAALARGGQKVVVVDFDVGLRNLDLGGAERPGKRLLITRFDPARVTCREMLGVDDVREVLPIPLLGIIPQSEDVLRASNLGAPITVCGRESEVSRACFDAARRIKGDRVEMTVPSKSKNQRRPLMKLPGRRAA